MRAMSRQQPPPDFHDRDLSWSVTPVSDAQSSPNDNLFDQSFFLQSSFEGYSPSQWDCVDGHAMSCKDEDVYHAPRYPPLQSETWAPPASRMEAPASGTPAAQNSGLEVTTMPDGPPASLTAWATWTYPSQPVTAAALSPTREENAPWTSSGFLSAGLVESVDAGIDPSFDAGEASGHHLAPHSTGCLDHLRVLQGAGSAQQDNVGAQATTEFACSICSVNLATLEEQRRHVAGGLCKPFPCLFLFAGCKFRFLYKNEWKRHVNTIHVIVESFICTLGSCAKKGPKHSLRPLPSVWTRQAHLVPLHGTVATRIDLLKNHMSRAHGEVASDMRSLPGVTRIPLQMPPSMACYAPGCEESFSDWAAFLHHVADVGHLRSPLSPLCPRGRWLVDFGLETGFLKETCGAVRFANSLEGVKGHKPKSVGNRVYGKKQSWTVQKRKL
ncbi:hypothetical protein RJ55_03179 [Drechmeria coniospora]|nr:hypothetical protein RJ55_03179 [Drechmeria coniospora]